MYFESVFIKPANFYINIYNMNLSKKFMKIAKIPDINQEKKITLDTLKNLIVGNVCTYKLEGEGGRKGKG